MSNNSIIVLLDTQIKRSVNQKRADSADSPRENVAY